jgi:two-component system CheB/CheR fusion protein
LLGMDIQGAVLMMADVERVHSMISSQDMEERRQQE